MLCALSFNEKDDMTHYEYNVMILGDSIINQKFLKSFIKYAFTT